ncbi:DUF2180 family protein [Candidatus Bathyarchaeota archaeon]|nr:MAG: DUF2180 family protein [Candidatus Bathyarchaeota archaeon]TMI52266.1 MAG: DUF2180 family protein [Candidatus Bathyarchaeota archaeon]
MQVQSPLAGELGKCMRCTLFHRPSVAVCLVCGIGLCEKHAYQDGGEMVCSDHVSDTLRQQLK